MLAVNDAELMLQVVESKLNMLRAFIVGPLKARSDAEQLRLRFRSGLCIL